MARSEDKMKLSQGWEVNLTMVNILIESFTRIWKEYSVLDLRKLPSSILVKSKD